MSEIETIASRDNSKIRFFRKVRDGKIPGSIFVEGSRLAYEAARSSLTLQTCIVTPEFASRESNAEILALLKARGVFVDRAADRIFRTIADTENPQGIILAAGRPENSLATIRKNLAESERTLPIVLFLNEINNPSNLGAILRTAEAAGCGGVIVSKNSADVFSPKAIRAAMGSSFRIAVWENVDIGEALDWARDVGLQTTTADINAKSSYSELNWMVPRMVIFGSEGRGIDPMIWETSDDAIHIPMANGVESLNLAVSAGIILFEAKRQFEN